MSITCLSCRHRMSPLRVALQWPTFIICQRCDARHAYAYGHLIGAAFMAVLLPACLVPLLMSGDFDAETGGIQPSGSLEMIVHFGTLTAILVGFGLLQGALLRRFGTLRLVRTHASDGS
ncbi:hypothetical protein ACQQ2N_06145 [Dokdonella sp. MW10]|uniref:hypothetical protein n=1 Tax=Dokdonella sp. MW10 TaxID=2992926 RepID=UPI003F7F5757